MPALSSLRVGRVLLVEVAQRLEAPVPSQRRVVERDLRVEADQALGRTSRRRAASRDDRQRVDLDEIRVVRHHRGEQALRDGHERR